MITDLTKSITSFSWALSLFGVQQASNLLTPQSPGQPTHSAAAAFNRVAQVSEEQLGQTLKGVYKAGDQIQKGAIDLGLNILTLQAFNPSQMMRTVSDVMKQSSNAFSQSTQQSASGSHQYTSWDSV
jgi:hypothetical protein